MVSGATPVMRDSEHFFFDLPSFQRNVAGMDPQRCVAGAGGK
ncbi:hypothetical protein ACLK1S_13170 [Escherichia coli]